MYVYMYVSFEGIDSNCCDPLAIFNSLLTNIYSSIYLQSVSTCFFIFLDALYWYDFLEEKRIFFLKAFCVLLKKWPS